VRRSFARPNLSVHGLIFTSLRDYLAHAHGDTIEREVLGDEPVYVVSEAYPDERFEALVERACIALDTDRAELLFHLGVFTVERTFARLYPALFSLSPTARDFLLAVEQPIHELVRTAMPNAVPPKLTISSLDEQRLSIVYDSPRRLCELLRGLVHGTARHYGEDAEIEELTCMHRGDRECLLYLRLERRPDPAEHLGPAIAVRRR
jgi:hypothetical protein